MNAIVDQFLMGGEGIYRDVPNEIYHGDRTAVSSSGLKLLLRSPAHFVAGQGASEETTAALEFGTALHTALLEPEKYREQYVTKPDINRRTKEGKALAETIGRALADKIQLSATARADIEAMVRLSISGV